MMKMMRSADMMIPLLGFVMMADLEGSHIYH